MAVLRKAPSKALTAYLRSHKRLQQRNGKRTQIFKHSLGLSCTAKTSINTVVYTCLHACTCTILGHVLKHTAWSKLCSVDPRNDRTHFSSLNNDECRPGGSECDYYSISRLEAFNSGRRIDCVKARHPRRPEALSMDPHSACKKPVFRSKPRQQSHA